MNTRKTAIIYRRPSGVKILVAVVKDRRYVDTAIRKLIREDPDEYRGGDFLQRRYEACERPLGAMHRQAGCPECGRYAGWREAKGYGIFCRFCAIRMTPALFATLLADAERGYRMKWQRKHRARLREAARQRLIQVAYNDSQSAHKDVPESRKEDTLG